VGALFRILDLGVEEYLLNSALMGIVAQRLIRKVCTKCKKSYQPTLEDADLFSKIVGRFPKQLVRGEGCEECSELTFKGRTGIFEVLVMTSRVRDLLRSKINEDDLRNKLIKEGFVTLLRDGLEKAETGVTTIDEVLRNSLRVV
jgi:type II secretory ATPase GspE/PulE/Tfp pilus assembly ATPase PilB-like protein